MNDSDTIKQEADYTIQTNIPCCDTCTYGEWSAYDGVLECSQMHYTSVSPVGICKNYKLYVPTPQDTPNSP